MSALEPFDRELLDFLCACAHHRVRVVRVKAPRIASLRRLRFAGLVGFDDYLPSPSALQGWTERQQTKSEAETARPADDEPPTPMAAVEGGGAARCDAPPPIDEDRLLSCFGDEFEQLSVIAARFGVLTPRIITVSRRLRTNGLVETDPPKRARPFALWRRAKSNTKGESGTAREAPSATESTVAEADDLGSAESTATRTEGRTPTEEPAPIVAPSARARPAAPKVDIKVNERRDPTQRPDTPMMDLRERQHANGMRRVAQVNRGIEQKAAERLDAGEKGRNSVESAKMAEIERRRTEEARLTDPVEMAKTVIRIAGWNCFAAVIKGGPPDHYYIGTRVVPEAELLTFAERLRTERRRRA